MFKFVFKKLIGRLGYEVSRTDLNDEKKILDLGRITKGPINAVYRADYSQSSAPNKWVTIDVPIDRMRSFPMRFSKNSQFADPFCETDKDYMNGSCITYEGSVLGF